MHRFSIYGTTINGNIIARSLMAATNSGTIHRFSIYGTTFNGNIIARSLMAATDSSTKLRFSIYKTTINGNILARSVIAATNSGTIPTPIIIAAICIAVITVVLKKSAMGMYIQSVGINRRASRIAGLNSQKIIFLCYVLCGLCAGIAGLVASSRITSADTNNIGLNFEMDAILAVALGGNSLAGGRFNLAGSIIGAYTIQAITTTMYNLGVSSAVNPVFKAVIVILIVAVQAPPVKAYFKKLSAKRQAEKEVKGAVGV